MMAAGIRWKDGVIFGRNKTLVSMLRNRILFLIPDTGLAGRFDLEEIGDHEYSAFGLNSSPNATQTRHEVYLLSRLDPPYGLGKPSKQPGAV